MRDLTLILNDILNNESLKKGNHDHQSMIHDTGMLQNGFPGDDDQLGRLKRQFERQSPKKVESIDDFEIELSRTRGSGDEVAAGSGSLDLKNGTTGHRALDTQTHKEMQSYGKEVGS
jgi:hypothetical protein